MCLKRRVLLEREGGREGWRSQETGLDTKMWCWREGGGPSGWCVLWGREKGWSVRADSEFVFVIDLWTTKGEVDVTF